MSAQNRYHRLFFLAVLPIWVLLHGCSMLSPAPTSTPVPTLTPSDTPTITPTFTETPTYTLTFTPTSTPTLTPTITPNWTATKAAKHEETVHDIMAEFEFSTDTGSLAWYQDETINVDITGTQGLIHHLEEIGKVSDFVLFTNMTWYSDSWPTCGVAFRTDSRWAKGTSYDVGFLRFSGLPAWEIVYWKDGLFAGIPSEQVRFSSYLNLDSGGSNDIILAAVGNEFKLYINNNYEGRYYDYDNKISTGMFGFYAVQDSGKTTCKFQDSWVWKYK
jgi:hypothetical protein